MMPQAMREAIDHDGPLVHEWRAAQLKRLGIPEPLAHGTETVLTGAVPDQAALFGVLSHIEALGLELFEVRRTCC